MRVYKCKTCFYFDISAYKNLQTSFLNDILHYMHGGEQFENAKNAKYRWKKVLAAPAAVYRKLPVREFDDTKNNEGCILPTLALQKKCDPPPSAVEKCAAV